MVEGARLESVCAGNCTVSSNLILSARSYMNKANQQLAQILWDYMKLNSPLEKADVIIGLGSTDVRTATKCAELYHQKLAPKILFTGGRGRISRDLILGSEADYYTSEAITLGVPESAIIREDQATNTGENILFSYEELKKLNMSIQTIILVTKPYMLRRAYATFIQQWPSNPKPKIICTGLDITLEEYCNDPNYSFEYVVNVMVGDLQRIIEYPKFGYQIKQDVPQNVVNAYEELVSLGYNQQLLTPR